MTREAALVLGSVRAELPIYSQVYDAAHPKSHFTPAVAAEVAPLFWANTIGLFTP